MTDFLTFEAVFASTLTIVYVTAVATLTVAGLKKLVSLWTLMGRWSNYDLDRDRETLEAQR